MLGWTKVFLRQSSSRAVLQKLKCSGSGKECISFFSPMALLTPESVKKNLCEKATKKERKKKRHLAWILPN